MGFNLLLRTCACDKPQTKEAPLLRCTKEKTQRHRKSEASVRGFILPCYVLDRDDLTQPSNHSETWQNKKWVIP